MGHIYTCEDGKEVPSVTTILSILGSKQITHWANILGFKKIRYDDELNKKAYYGTLAHQQFQKIVDPENAEDVKTNNAYELSYLNAVTDKWNHLMKDLTWETIFTEKTFASSSLGYGGTMDWFVNMANLNLIGDFKTSKEAHMKHFLQLGGYKNLLIEKGYRVDGGFILICNDKISKLRFVDRSQLDILGNAFQSIADSYHILSDDSLSIIPESNDFRNLILKKEDSIISP